MRRFRAHSSAAPATAWALYAQPARWHEWVPYLRGAWGLGHPEVEVGAFGAARLLGAVPVPARIVGKQPGRSWTWRVGGAVELVHRVDPAEDGCMVGVDLIAPPPLEQLLAATYGPIMKLTMRRLAHVAAQADRAAPGAASERASPG